MKKLLLCAAFIAANAHAADMNHCGQLGLVYQNAAFMRDRGNPPEMALQMTAAYAIDEKTRKKAINQVYFDPAFANAGGEALQYQIIGACMGKKPYQPLQ